jgi:hypothetical protein
MKGHNFRLPDHWIGLRRWQAKLKTSLAFICDEEREALAFSAEMTVPIDSSAR